ncbi:hypothetical protein FHX81_1001 [Saccharothrix saharensis]|uniref:Ig-like domain-containing protein n=1 Tax=Saccharothrix saharensis TaxID=571190 RepID=A0A543J7B0_9PSEU|nr:hypothetical protein [Saccharothrix saharensis]TQM78724.1 hypothetical protein FHX81_1001 [Saccharothrix saharensis]
MPFRRTLTALSTAVAAVLLVPSPASAAIPGDEQVLSHAGPSSYASRIASVSCPAGKQVVGAFAYARGARRDVLVTALIPSATSVVALAQEDQDGTEAEWSLTVEAMCAFPVPGHTVVQSSSDATSSNKQVRATCPSGRKLLASGWNTRGAGQVHVNQIAPTPDLTSVAVTGMEDPDGYGGDWRLTTYAVCSDPLPGQGLRTATSVVDQGDKWFDVRCGSDQRRLSAGWSFIGTAGVTPAGQVLPNIWATGTSWFELDVWEDDDGFAHEWYAIGRVVCVDR